MIVLVPAGFWGREPNGQIRDYLYPLSATFLVTVMEKLPSPIEGEYPLSSAGEIYGGVASPPLVSPPGLAYPSRGKERDVPGWSSSVQTLLDQPPATLSLRLLVGGTIFCAAFGTWAWFAKVDGAISREMLFQAEQSLRDTEQKITLAQLQDVNGTNEQLFQASRSLQDLKAQLPDREAGFIRQGLSAQVKFDAFPYQDYGVIVGKVTNISADSKPDKEGRDFYQVEISLPPAKGADRSLHFKPGQTATAEIIIRRRRVIDILVEPFQKIPKDGLTL